MEPLSLLFSSMSLLYQVKLPLQEFLWMGNACDICLKRSGCWKKATHKAIHSFSQLLRPCFFTQHTLPRVTLSINDMNWHFCINSSFCSLDRRHQDAVLHMDRREQYQSKHVRVYLALKRWRTDVKCVQIGGDNEELSWGGNPATKWHH